MNVYCSWILSLYKYSKELHKYRTEINHVGLLKFTGIKNFLIAGSEVTGIISVRHFCNSPRIILQS